MSLAQNVDSILFEKDAPLRDEFRYLYASIFKNPDPYITIVKTLGEKRAGMTRSELISEAGIANSGKLSERLEELESCGFIKSYASFGKKSKGVVYQLIDNFTLFYYKFLKNRPDDEHFWSNQINTPAVNTWTGLAFERVCLMHIRELKRKLGIEGVLTNANAFYCEKDPDRGVFGSQIDLLIVRRDQVINLCEIKYSGTEYTLTEKEDRSISRRIHDLQTVSGTKYAIHPTLITTYGLADNMYSGNVQSVITMNDLFKA